MSGKSRFGQGRGPGCECTHNFTCGTCLRNAPLWFCTPTTVSEQVYLDGVRMREERRLAEEKKVREERMREIEAKVDPSSK
jgi:hypothetical protein